MDDTLMNLKQAAEFLGISEKLLMKLLQEEDIPGRKLGKEWRFERSAIKLWISQGSSKQYTKGTAITEDEEIEE